MDRIQQDYFNSCVDRLVNDWKQHGKIIIAVDYDDTLSPWKMHRKDDIANLGVTRILHACCNTGAYIVCFTACNKDRYPEIEQRFKTLRLPLDAINRNPINLPYGQDDGSKIFYNILLDDRAGLSQSLSILETALYKFRGYLKLQEHPDDVA